MYVYKQTIYTYTYTYCQEPYTFIITQFFMLDVHVPNESLFLSNSSQTRGPRAAATTKHHMNANNCCEQIQLFLWTSQNNVLHEPESFH